MINSLNKWLRRLRFRPSQSHTSLNGSASGDAGNSSSGSPASDGSKTSVILYGYPTPETFVEEDYLSFNPDIAHAVRSGALKSGRDHFNRFGEQKTHKVPFRNADPDLLAMRKLKAAKIAEIIRPPFSSIPDASGVFDCLTEGMRESFGVIDTDNVSSNDYDHETIELININSSFILDCGAGSRPVYYNNVVNYEIARYKSTDVVGVAEVLPFEDNSFDVVLSYAVLEHVKQPFVAASEIIRVLKPGGILRVQVPFLQPLHGFPSHYFNMTQYGIRALFEQFIDIDQQFVVAGPVWTMYTLIRAWHGGLPVHKRTEFLDLKLRDLFVHPTLLLNRDFVLEVSQEANFEAASATGLVGRKRAAPKFSEYELHRVGTDNN